MGVLPSESHELTAFYEMSTASFGVLPKIQDFILPQTGLLRSMLRPSDLGSGGRSYNEPISHLHCLQRSSNNFNFAYQISEVTDSIRVISILIK